MQIRATRAQVERGAFRLRDEQPARSAARGAGLVHGAAIVVALTLAAVALLAWPEVPFHALHGAGVAIFAAVAAFRALATLVPPDALSRTPPAAESEDGEETGIPTWSVLCAIHDEAASVPSLVAAMEALNWPRDRFEVLYLVEEADTATLAALEAATLPRWHRVVVLPPLGPRTKPRALSIGMQLAAGAHVTVFDAEDRPHPNQIRAAWRAYRADPRLACVQAPLHIHNGDQGWIARQFDAEYAVHFGQALPLLVAVGGAIPLGGTSNHFRRDALESVMGWDPYNVTEDADIGFRLQAARWQIGLIAPPTAEEAPVRFDPDWLGQRTRWIKGHLMTLLVLTRDPLARVRELGLWRWACACGLMAGGMVSALLFMPFVAWTVLQLAAGRAVPAVDVVVAAAGLLAGMAGIAVAALRRRDPRLLRAIPLLPLYWALQLPAAILALVDLGDRPHHWIKTPHGHSLDAVRQARHLALQARRRPPRSHRRRTASD